MPTRKGDAPRPPTGEKVEMVTVPAEFGQALAAEAKRRGLELDELIAEKGANRITSWRMTSGKGSVKAAMRAIHVLTEHAERTKDPLQLPPLVLHASADLAEWIAIGQRLRRLSPEQFARQFEKIRNLVDSIESSSSDDLDGALHPTHRR